MSIWILIAGIEIVLLYIGLRLLYFWKLLRKAETFLTRQASFLSMHKFDDDVKQIRNTTVPQYFSWRMQTVFVLITLYFTICLLGLTGVSIVAHQGSYILNGVTTFFVVAIGYFWSYSERRVDILNTQCDYVDNLVNIIKDNKNNICEEA